MPKNRPMGNSKWLMLTKPAPGQGRVIGQVRFSSKLQDMRSIAEQKQNILNDAAAEGWEVVGWTEEPETSAQYDELERRPEFLHLLTNLAGRECNVIMCDETSRWSRSDVGNKALRMLRERGCWWQTADGQWDINKPLTDGGSILWAITQGMNEDYLRKISYHVRKGKKAKAREGYSNGYPMFGYQVPEIHIAPQIGNLQREREIRRRIVYTPHPTYFLALQKLGELLGEQPPRSASGVAEELNRLGYTYWSPQRGERRWVGKYVYHLMARSYHREFAPGCGHGTIETPDGECVEGLHVAAWPYKTCQRIDENWARSADRVRITPTVRKGILAFSGLVSCVYCKHRMATHQSNVTNHDMRYEYN